MQQQVIFLFFLIFRQKLYSLLNIQDMSRIGRKYSARWVWGVNKFLFFFQVTTMAIRNFTTHCVHDSCKLNAEMLICYVLFVYFPPSPPWCVLFSIWELHETKWSQDFLFDYKPPILQRKKYKTFQSVWSPKLWRPMIGWSRKAPRESWFSSILEKNVK